MKGSTTRVPFGWEYWAVSANVFDVPAYYKARDRRDAYDQKVWDSGRYFLCESDAREYVRKERERQRKAIKKKRKAAMNRKLAEAMLHGEMAKKWRNAKKSGTDEERDKADA